MPSHCDFCVENDATHRIDIYDIDTDELVDSRDICDECLGKVI